MRARLLHMLVRPLRTRHSHMSTCLSQSRGSFHTGEKNKIKEGCNPAAPPTEKLLFNKRLVTTLLHNSAKAGGQAGTLELPYVKVVTVHVNKSNSLNMFMYV